MNKPRTRAEHSLARAIAFDGDKSELFKEIGRFVFEYSQLEEYLRRIFRRKVGFAMQHRDIMATGFDFARLCSAIKALSAAEEGGLPDPRIKKLMGQCNDINALRIVVVHGTWSSSYAGDEVSHVSRDSMKPNRKFENAGDLDRASEDIVAIRAAISEAISAGNERRKLAADTVRPE